VIAESFVVLYTPGVLFGVFWFLSYHPRHHRVECDGIGKNFVVTCVL